MHNQHEITDRFSPSLSDTITVTFPTEWASSIHTEINLITTAASGTSGPLVSAGQLGPSTRFTGSVADAHLAVSDMELERGNCRLMERITSKS